MTKTAAAAIPFAPETGAPPPIIQVPINNLYLASEAPKGVDLQVRDSSRGSPLTDAELKASIYAKGIIQPLIWKKHDGKFYVVAGNRRLRFLREIFADAPASTVQTQDVDDFGGDWREVAIDTNLALPPHLVERYELIVKLAADMKLSPADTQARFGMSPQQYGRVMALGKMAPKIRQAWKDAMIDAKTAQAFTLEPDPKEQERIFDSLVKQERGRISDYDVKRKIIPQTQQEVGKLVAFVGLEGVRAAKLLKQEDMFATETSASHIVTDVKALNKLVGDRIAAKCAELVKAGWSWATAVEKAVGSRWQYGTIEPAKRATATAAEKSRLAEIERLMSSDEDEDFDEEALFAERERLTEDIKQRGYTDQQRQKAGCFLEIHRDGSLVIEYGRVKPQEQKSVAASERSTNVAAKKKAKASKTGAAVLTNALAERLSLQLEKALAASIGSTPHVAVAALIAAFASNGHVLDVQIGGEGRHSYGKSGSSEKNFASVFDGAVKASPESRAVMLAGVVKEAVSIQVRNALAKAPIDDGGLQALIEKMDPKTLNAAIAAEFDAKDYFAGVNAAACVEAVRCSMGDEHAEKVAKMKKGDAAKFAAANVTAKGWLPRELRTVHYKGPVEAAAKPKAVAKKPAAKAAKKKAKK